MPFPEVQRVIYRRNPLDQVVCQLRFPPILRIESDIPADFQDIVRVDFPNFSETLGVLIEVPKELKGKVPLDLFAPPNIKNYEFSSEDGQWKVNLTRTFVALTANKYERWEEFKDKLVGPLNALIDVYSPIYFSRVGLRYINVIKRSELGLDGVDWSELLEPYVMGILGVPEVGDRVEGFESNYQVRLSDEESIVRIVTGFVVDPDMSERYYRIDNDFFNVTKIDINVAMEKLDYFNQRGSRLFRWCITDRLHEAMEPELL